MAHYICLDHERGLNMTRFTWIVVATASFVTLASEVFADRGVDDVNSGAVVSQNMEF